MVLRSFELPPDAGHDLAQWRVKEHLVKRDEGTLFRLANEFGIRHQNAQQQADYNPVFLDWVFWFDLATIELSDRLLARQGVPE